MDDIYSLGLLGFFILFMIFIVIFSIIAINIQKEVCDNAGLNYNYNSQCVKDMGDGSVELYEVENVNGWFQYKLNKYPTIPN